MPATGVASALAYALLAAGCSPLSDLPDGRSAGSATLPGQSAPGYAVHLLGTVSGPRELVGNTGAALIGNTGAALIGNTGAALVGNTGAALGGNTGPGLVGSKGGALADRSGLLLTGFAGNIPAGRFLTASGRIAANLDPVRVAGAVVYLMTPGDEFYVDASGSAVMTTTDAAGRYELPASLDRPLMVAAVLPGNRRLVGYSYLSSPGSHSLDVSLETTYVTEFLRDRALRDQRPIENYDRNLEKVARLSALTRQMLEARTLDASPDISIGAIPELVADYLVAFSSRSRELSDAWRDLLGYRPLAVSTLAGSTAEGFNPTAVAAAGATAGDRVFVAGVDKRGVEIREMGVTPPIFSGRASSGHTLITALTTGSGQFLDFANNIDRFLGGAVSRGGGITGIRLFRFGLSGEGLDEKVLAVPDELARYLEDRSLATQIEPADLEWDAGVLYVGDFATGLVYSFTPGPDTTWRGVVHAGTVVEGRPVLGHRNGLRREALFGHITHLAWHDGALYVSDGDNHVIRKIGRDSLVSDALGVPGRRGFGGDGGPPGEALLDFPKAVAFDSSGRMFVADAENHRIRVVEDGTIRTIVGGGTGSGGRDGDARDITVGTVVDLAFDRAGNLLFTDEATGKVRRLWLQYGR